MYPARTVAAAPSKLQRPAGSRVKTDAIDAEHLSTLLRLDAILRDDPDELTPAAVRLSLGSSRVRGAYDTVVRSRPAVIVSISGSQPWPQQSIRRCRAQAAVRGTDAVGVRSWRSRSATGAGSPATRRLVRRPSPSNAPPGQSRCLGSITKTGNSHARRLLVETAWRHQHRYVPGKTIRDRWDLASLTANPAVMPGTAG